jgi:hypothetical protein
MNVGPPVAELVKVGIPCSSGAGGVGSIPANSYIYGGGRSLGYQAEPLTWTYLTYIRNTKAYQKYLH